MFAKVSMTCMQTSNGPDAIATLNHSLRPRTRLLAPFLAIVSLLVTFYFRLTWNAGTHMGITQFLRCKATKER